MRGPAVSEATDFTGQVFVNGLHGERMRYRVWFEDGRGNRGPAEEGSFARRTGA